MNQQCEFLHFDKCLIASRMSNRLATTNADACRVCMREKTRENQVTASLAIRSLPRPIPPEYLYLYDMVEHIVKKSNGVGTQLKLLIGWWFVPSATCDCHTIVDYMNDLGPDGCMENMQEILKRISRSAVKNQVKYGRFLVWAFGKRLVKKAIVNERRRLARLLPIVQA